MSGMTNDLASFSVDGEGTCIVVLERFEPDPLPADAEEEEEEARCDSMKESSCASRASEVAPSGIR